MRKLFAVLITLLIIPVSFSLIFTWLAFSLVGKPDTIKQTLTNQNIYDKTLTILPNYLVLKPDSPVKLNDAEKNRIIKAAFNPEDLQTITESTLDKTYNWMSGRSSTLTIHVDFSTYKPKAEKEIEAVLKEQYAKLPECSTLEIMVIHGQKITNSQFPTCRLPAAEQYQSIYANFEPSLYNQGSLDNIKDHIYIENTGSRNVQITENEIHYPLPTNAQKAPSYFQSLTFSLEALAVFDLILFIILALLLRSWPKTMVRWLSVVSLLISLPLTILAYFGQEPLKKEISGYLNHSLSEAPPALSNMVNSVVNSLINQLHQDLYTLSLIILGIGILSIIISFFLPSQHSKIKIQKIEDDQKIIL